MNDLSRLKSELDGRIEEDQDEIEELLEKQRSHLSQASSLQAQLVEKQMQVEEVEEAKASLESKVIRCGGWNKSVMRGRDDS